ncbi:MAG: hypothetical protein PHD70_14020 [Anaerostipes sp.]|nr:hypothetical protein [Anaerostipes sp.]MDD3747574.1 hypothetical protein [Anaerostipes sp.]
MRVNIISPVIFLLGNLLLVFQDNLNFSKNCILLINIVAIIGIVFALVKSHIKIKFKVAIIGLYIIYFVIYLMLRG